MLDRLLELRLVQAVLIPAGTVGLVGFVDQYVGKLLRKVMLVRCKQSECRRHLDSDTLDKPE